MSNRVIMRNLGLDGEKFVLEFDESQRKFYLRSGTTSEDIELDPAQGIYLQNGRSEEHLTYSFQSRGLFISRQAQRSKLAQQRDSIRARFPENSSLVMLDSTTLRNAFHCLESGFLSPLNFLDLGIVAFASICYDRIMVHMDGATREHFKSQSDIIQELAFTDEFVTGTLWDLAMQDVNLLSSSSDSEDGKYIHDAWCEYLGIEADEFTFDAKSVMGYQRSPEKWDGMVATGYMNDMFDSKIRNGEEKKSRDEFLSIQTTRLIFNDHLAGFLNLPYLCSSFRACVHAKLIKQKVIYREEIDTLLSLIGPPLEAKRPTPPQMAELSAPFLLGLILRQMEKPKDFWSVVRDYRNRFAPLRKDLRESQHQSSSAYLSKFREVINKDLSSLVKKGDDVIEAIVATGVVFGGATVLDRALINLGLKFLKLFDPTEKLYKTTLKLFKPEIYLLFSLSDEATHLRRVENQVKAIWGKGWSRKEHELLEKLALSYPAQFLNLRDLGYGN